MSDSSTKLTNNLALLLLPLALFSCEKEEPVVALPPRPVVSYLVPEGSTESTRRFSGETKPARSVNLGFELAGRIDSIIAEEGKRYTKGTILAQLDPASANADLQNAQAQATQAIQQLRRTQELLESGNASQADFDSAIANQKASEARLKSAKLGLQYTNLIMPYDGTVSSIPADPNEVVAAGTPVIAIQGNLGMNFEISVPSNLISRIKEKQPVTISLSDLSAQKITGTVTKVSPIAASNTAYPITISINEPTKIKDLRAGLDGEALFEFPNQGKPGIPLPGSAVLALPDGTNYVWLIDSPEQKTSTVSRQAVTIGELSEQGQIDVLSGLTPGQRIVSKGVQSLTPGMEVALPKK